MLRGLKQILISVQLGFGRPLFVSLAPSNCTRVKVPWHFSTVVVER